MSVKEGRRKKVAAPWQAISRFKGDGCVTLWLSIYASPMSMGWSDAFAVADCWRESDGQWMHLFNGEPTEIRSEYVTHFALAGVEPPTGPDGSVVDWWGRHSR